MKGVSKILHYVKSIQGLAKHPSNKSMVRQIVEVFCLFLRSRLGPGFYLEAKLYESSTAVSTLLGFLSISEYKKTVNRLNNRLYQRCSQNKVVEKAVLTAYGIPTPQLLGHFQVERGYGVNGCPLRERGDFFRLLAAQEPGEKFCIKFVESWGGQGFRAFEVVDDESVLDLATGKQKNHDQLYSEIEKDVGDGLIIEKYLKQHPAYSEFNQSSLNMQISQDLGCLALEVGD